MSGNVKEWAAARGPNLNPFRGGASNNVIVVGHGNLMRAATGAYPDEAGAGVFRPDPAAAHGFRLVAELGAADWVALAAELGGKSP